MFPHNRCRPGQAKREPGPITTNGRLSKAGAPACHNHKLLWLWVPAFAGTTDHFFAAARSTKVLPPFILWASGASLIWITTASASTPRFFTSACVMSRIMPIFCSSVRPAAMLTVISGIAFFLLLPSFPASFGPATSLYQTRRGCPAQDRHDVMDEWLTPLHVMPDKNFPYRIDQLARIDLGLRLGLPLQVFVTILGVGKTGAENEVLDQDLALRPFVRTLHDGARRIAAV